MSTLRRGPAEVRANMTPMIDVTFLLIVFFVLVSQIVESESVDMELPTLVQPATLPPGDEQRIVINVVPGAFGSVSEYRVGAHAIAPGPGAASALQRHLAPLLARQPTLRINLRADARTHYEYVHPVVEAVSAAATTAARSSGRDVMPRLQLVIVPEENG